MSEHTAKFKAIDKTLKAHRDLIDTKVSRAEFRWIFGTFLTVLIVLFGYIANQLRDVQYKQESLNDKTGAIQSSVAEVQGKLQPYDIEFK